MEPKLITFKTFNDIALAYNLAELLNKHDITYYMEELATTFDPGFRTQNEASKEYAIKISSNDFELVNQLLKEDVSESLNEVGNDHYLFDFTDDELLDVLAKADEWNEFDVLLARKILTERGNNISEATITGLNRKRMEELKVPEPSQSLCIIIGYLCAIVGGILGIFIGWHLKTHKKILPNGERAFSYNDKDRKHGKIIFYLSIVSFAIFFIIKITNMISHSDYF